MEEIAKIFGKKLRKLREQKKMNQDDLSDKLGLHHSYIGLLERGERIPSMLTLTKTAKYFDVNSVELITEDVKPIKLSSKQKALLKIIDSGSRQDIDRLHDIAKVVIDKSKSRKKTKSRKKS